MWELLIDPIKTFLKGGIGAFTRSKEFGHIALAVRDRVRRECKFNGAVLDDLLGSRGKKRYTDDDALILIATLKTDAYQKLDEGVIPVALYFDTPLQKELWPEYLRNQNRYMDYVKGINSLPELFDRTYYRILLAQTFAAHHRAQGDYRYLKFVVDALRLSLEQSESHSR